MNKNTTFHGTWNEKFNNAESTAANETYLIPEGDYVLRVKNVDMKTTSDKTGEYVRIIYEVVNPDWVGATFKNIYHLKNRNPIAVKYGVNQLREIYKACHVKLDIAPYDIHRGLWNHKIIATVTIKMASDSRFGYENYAKNFRSVDNSDIRAEKGYNNEYESNF